MRGVTIRDQTPTGVLAFDLRDILELLGDAAISSDWQLTDVECTGNAAAALHQAADTGQTVSGERLLTLARDIIQVIDGEFAGRRATEHNDWIVIRAVDSSAFDVLTDEAWVFSALANRFTRIEDDPGST
jgi:hypothetical protein